MDDTVGPPPYFVDKSEWSSTVSTSSLLDPAEASNVTPRLSDGEEEGSDGAALRDDASRSPISTAASVESVSVELLVPQGPAGGGGQSALVDGREPSAATTLDAVSERKREKDAERERRKLAVLTNKTLDDLCVFTVLPNPATYHVPGAIASIHGSFSQFMKIEQSNGLLPPLTHDCCQTFSTVAAILFSSFEFVVLMEECWNTTSVNYLVYLSAWLHQLTIPLRQERSRPRIEELNSCLDLRNRFPAKIDGSEFLVLFYDQILKARDLIKGLCVFPGAHNGKVDPVCGYVIVSGEYTVSVFCLHHDVGAKKENPFEAAWSLFIADSHGTMPWALGRASLSCLSLGKRKKLVSTVDTKAAAVVVDVDAVPTKATTEASCSSRAVAETSNPRPGGGGKPRVLPFHEGIEHFTQILFSLLEDHRKLKRLEVTRGVPYMTWTPIRRRPGSASTCVELTKLIDEEWLPDVLRKQEVAQERLKFGSMHPRPCFWGQIVKTKVRRPQATVVEDDTPKETTTTTMPSKPESVVSSRDRGAAEAQVPQASVEMPSQKPVSLRPLASAATMARLAAAAPSSSAPRKSTRSSLSTTSRNAPLMPVRRQTSLSDFLEISPRSSRDLATTVPLPPFLRAPNSLVTTSVTETHPPAVTGTTAMLQPAATEPPALVSALSRTESLGELPVPVTLVPRKKRRIQ